MATTGTYAWAPNAGDIVLQAFARIGLRRASLLTEHFADARAELNLIQSSWANRGPNLWTIDQQTISIIAGTAAYAVPASTLSILEAWTSADGIDTSISQVTREDYANMTQKGLEGTPRQFWYQRTPSPTITFWPVPDEAATFKFFRTRMQQDAEMSGAAHIDITPRWIDALVAELSYRLARIYNAPLEQARKADAMEAFAAAAASDTEGGEIMLAPDLSSYYR